MGLVASIARGMGARVARTSDTTLDALNWADSGWSSPTAAGVMVGQASAMQVSTVFACVSMISYDIAKLGAAIFRGQRMGKRQKATDHYLSSLLKEPAPWLTWFEFCGMMQASVLLRGNGYAVILRDARGKPVMLVPVNPDRVALWEAPDGSLFYMVTRSGLHEMAVLRNEPLLIAAEDIFHLKALTLNGLLGLSPISMNREAIGLAIAQEQLASRWAGNSAKPSGILTTDQKLSPDAAKRLHEDWKTLNSGLYNAGKTAILEQGLKWQALAMTSSDMEFIASRQFQLTEIARVYRVPLHKLGEMTRTTGNSITQLAQEYLNDCLSTWLEMWERRLAYTFGIDEDQDELFVEFNVDRILRADITSRYAANRVALGGTGWMTINEIRSGEGQQKVEGGDVVFRPLNTIPADQKEEDPLISRSEPGSDQTGQQAEGGGRPPNKVIAKT